MAATTIEWCEYTFNPWRGCTKVSPGCTHCYIENTCHWSLDVTYREDDSRIRDQHLRENFAWLNRFTLSLLKQHPSRDSLAMKRRCCGWNDDFLAEVLTGQTT